MNTISELPFLLPQLKLIVVHGKGRGGGEKCAVKMVAAYSKTGKAPAVVNSGDRAEMVSAIRSLRGSSGVSVLFSGGMRDLPGALAAKQEGIKFAVYLQVPYLRSISMLDPTHASAVIAMTAYYRLFASDIFVNTQSSWPSWLKGRILLPITSDEIVLNPAQTWPGTRLVRLVTASRLFSERGKGSKDLESLIRFIAEVRLNNVVNSKQQIQLIHNGDIDLRHKKLLNQHSDVFTARGYASDWITNDPDVAGFFFFSKYEGFGLAPLEAARTGLPVYVNEGFPLELMKCGPIRQISTRDFRQSILEQMRKK